MEKDAMRWDVFQHCNGCVARFESRALRDLHLSEGANHARFSLASSFVPLPFLLTLLASTLPPSTDIAE